MVQSFQKSTTGMTLIEVLIALAIVSIALTAVIKAAAQNIRSTNYLQNKTVALWTGQNILNEIRVGKLVLPGNDDSLEQKSKVLGINWYWEAKQEATPNKRISKITVKVFDHEKKGDEDAPLVTLQSYYYGEPKS